MVYNVIEYGINPFDLCGDTIEDVSTNEQNSTIVLVMSSGVVYEIAGDYSALSVNLCEIL